MVWFALVVVACGANLSVFANERQELPNRLLVVSNEEKNSALIHIMSDRLKLIYQPAGFSFSSLPLPRERALLSGVQPEFATLKKAQVMEDMSECTG